MVFGGKNAHYAWSKYTRCPKGITPIIRPRVVVWVWVGANCDTWHTRHKGRFLENGGNGSMGVDVDY
jgi:hypothetical protein